MDEWVASLNLSRWHSARLYDNDEKALMAAADNRPDHSAELQNATAPFLLIVGEKDTDYRNILEISKLIPDCSLMVLEGIGHFGLLTRSEQVISHLRNFF